MTRAAMEVHVKKLETSSLHIPVSVRVVTQAATVKQVCIVLLLYLKR